MSLYPFPLSRLQLGSLRSPIFLLPLPLMRSLVSGYRPSYLNKLGISSSLIEQSSAINPSLQMQVPFVQFPLKLQSFGHRFCAIFTGGTKFPSSSLS